MTNRECDVSQAGESGVVLRLKYRVRTEFDEPSLMHCETVVVKHGPRAYKTASLLTYGDTSTGRISSRTFRFQTWRAHQYEGGYDFSRAENTWSCDDNEMGIVQAFLNGEFAEPGEYLLVPTRSGPAALIQQLDDDQFDMADVRQIIAKLASIPKLADALARSAQAEVIAAALTHVTQSNGLERLRRVVSNPKSLEPHIQKVLQEEWWVFGGKYVSAAARRSFTVLDQFDIALIRADGSIHLVEIKQANIPSLVKKDHSHWIVGEDVHKAVSQAMNYLRSLDEQRSQILADFQIDCRRGSATIVGGHPQFVQTGATETQLAEAIRTYNSHLARIEVITYGELIQTAERFLQLGQESVQVTAESDAPTPDAQDRDPWYTLAVPKTYSDPAPWDDDAPF